MTFSSDVGGRLEENYQRLDTDPRPLAAHRRLRRRSHASRNFFFFVFFFALRAPNFLHSIIFID